MRQSPLLRRFGVMPNRSGGGDGGRRIGEAESGQRSDLKAGAKNPRRGFGIESPIGQKPHRRRNRGRFLGRFRQQDFGRAHARERVGQFGGGAFAGAKIAARKIHPSESGARVFAPDRGQRARFGVFDQPGVG